MKAKAKCVTVFFSLAAAYLFSILFFAFILLPHIYTGMDFPDYDEAAPLALAQWRNFPYFLAMTVVTALLAIVCFRLVERDRQGENTPPVSSEAFRLNGLGIKLEISRSAVRNILIALLVLQIIYCLFPYDPLADMVRFSLVKRFSIFDLAIARDSGWRRLIASAVSGEVIHQIFVFITVYLFKCVTARKRETFQSV